MKNTLIKILLYIIGIIFVIMLIIALLWNFSDSEASLWEFAGNAILNLGGGVIWKGILLMILSIFGLLNSVYGLFHPPEFLADKLENAPEWIGRIYFAFSIMGTAAIFYLFSKLLI